MRKRFTVGGTIAGVLIGLFAPVSVFAAGTSGTNITTSPVSSVLHTAPGTPLTTTISVQNNSSKPVDVKLQLQTFKPYGTSGRAQIIPPQPNADYIKWVHFSQDAITAQPGVWQKIQVTISPPPTASLEYYYAILVKPVGATTKSGNSTILKGYNAVLVLLDVRSPNDRPQLKVSNFSSDHGLYEYLPASFKITASNTGNVFLAPAGDIYISKSSDFKSTLATLPINSAAGNVIPGSARDFTSQWNDGFPLFVPKTIAGQTVNDNSGNPIEQLKWDFTQANKFRFGKYYAKMVFVYNNGQRDVPISAVVSFWVVPWKLGSIVIIVLALLIFGVYTAGRKLVAKTANITKKVPKEKE